MKSKINELEKGQSLITLIFISIIGISIAMGATMLVFINSQSGLKYQQGELAYAIAQSGAENALLRLLRDPSYSGETMTVGSGTATVGVQSISSGNYIATSSGMLGNFTRKIQITAHYNSDNVLIMDSRKEIY
jgi:hypothetical protein